MCALVYCLSCVMTLQFPLLAQSAESESGRLRQYEKVVLGKAGKAPSLQARLGALEQSLFGTTQKGTIDERLDRIGKAVGTPGAPPSPVPPATETAPPLTTANAQRQEGHVIFSASSARSADSLLRQGIKQYGAAHYTEAADSFGRVLQLDPGNCHAIYNLGAIDERYGNLEGALRKYEQALSLNPDDAEIEQAVSSVTQQLADRRAAETRSRAEQEYLSAVQQAHTDKSSGKAVLQGSVAANEKRHPVVSVPVPSYGPYTAVTPQPRESGPSKAAVAARTAVAVGLMVGIGIAAGRGGGLGPLHCPICRLIGGH